MLPKNMQGLMKQAQKMQKQMMEMQEELAQRLVTAQSGGGMVEATVNGRGELQGLKIDPEVIDPDDAEMLADMIVAAVGEAQRQAAEMVNSEMGKVTGGMNLPGMF